MRAVVRMAFQRNPIQSIPPAPPSLAAALSQCAHRPRPDRMSRSAGAADFAAHGARARFWGRPNVMRMPHARGIHGIGRPLMNGCAAGQRPGRHTRPKPPGSAAKHTRVHASAYGAVYARALAHTNAAGCSTRAHACAYHGERVHIHFPDSEYIRARAFASSRTHTLAHHL